MKKIGCFCFLFFIISALFAGKGPQIKLTPVTVVGQDDPLLAYVESICEDDIGNFYILDSRVYKIHKFSPEGKLLLSFGRQGEGPGEILKPVGVYWSTEGNVIVTEYYPFASVFDRSGKFIKKQKFPYKLSGGGSFHYAGTDLFYTEKYDAGEQMQLLFNSEGKIVNPGIFKKEDTIIREKRGQNEMAYGFGIYSSAGPMTPDLLFNYYKGHAVAAFSKYYAIALLDSKGKNVAEIRRDIPPYKFSSEETADRKRSIDTSSRFPDHIKARFKTNLPKYKAYFTKISVSDAYVFVFRIPGEKDFDFWPVDLFTFDGSFVGTATMEEAPFYITSDFMYFKTEDKEGNFLVEKHKYEIVR